MRTGMSDRVTVRWVASHCDKPGDKFVPAEIRTNEQKGNIESDRVCTMMQRKLCREQPPAIPRRRSWRLYLRGAEVTGKYEKVIEIETQKQQLLKYFEKTRGWGKEAQEWVMHGIPKHWLLSGKPLAQRIVAMKYLYAMTWTDDVQAKSIPHPF